MTSSELEAETVVTACVLIIGNEILSGRTRDANLQYLAQGLTEAGVRLREVRVIPDVAETIVAAVNEVRRRYDYVFTTGGIGPTHDDITSESIARAFGVSWVVHAEARRILEAHYPEGAVTAARLRMATLPEGAELVRNPVSAAPGFRIGNVFVMAGVPGIMQAMFEGVKPLLAGGRPVRSLTVSCALPEGLIAEGLGALQDRHPELEIGSYPVFRGGAYRTSLVLRGTRAELLAAAAEELRALIRGLGGTPVEGELPES